MTTKNLARLSCEHCGEVTPHLVGHRDLPGGETSRHGICLRCDTIRDIGESLDGDSLDEPEEAAR